MDKKTKTKEKIEQAKGFLTFANLVSLSRALMAIPIIILLNNWDGKISHFPPYAVFWITLAIFSDYLDGRIARTYHEVSRVGKMLDPIVDKVVIIAVLLFSKPFADRIPAWFIYFIIIRDVLIAGIGLIVTRKTKRDLNANKTGKWSIFIMTIAVILALLKVHPYDKIILGLSVGFALVSWIFYMRLYFNYYKVDIKKHDS